MAFQAFLIALIIFVGKADYFVGTAMLGRPLVLGMLVGIALGDVSQGVIIGFQLELVFMGMQAIGASIPPDMIVGSVLGNQHGQRHRHGGHHRDACGDSLCLCGEPLLWRDYPAYGSNGRQVCRRGQ